MGGSGGVIVVRKNARTTLEDPVVHGQIPGPMCSLVDAVLAKEDADWTNADSAVIGVAIAWALLHCN